MFVAPKNPEAATPTRNVDAERGVGRAYRSETDMVPRLPSRLVIKQGAADQGRAVEVKKDLIGRPGAATVVVRSANTDPSGVGINKSNWGVAGVGDAAPAAPASGGNRMLLIIGVIAAAGAFLLLRKKSP